jgi:hypothetical protein
MSALDLWYHMTVSICKPRLNSSRNQQARVFCKVQQPGVVGHWSCQVSRGCAGLGNSRERRRTVPPLALTSVPPTSRSCDISDRHARSGVAQICCDYLCVLAREGCLEPRASRVKGRLVCNLERKVGWLDALFRSASRTTIRCKSKSWDVLCPEIYRHVL